MSACFSVLRFWPATRRSRSALGPNSRSGRSAADHADGRASGSSIGAGRFGPHPRCRWCPRPPSQHLQSVDSGALLALAEGLEITIAELLTLLSLSARTPLSALDSRAAHGPARKDVPWSQTIEFLREVDWMGDAGVDPAFLDRMCRHRGVAEDASAETDPLLIAVLALAQTATPTIRSSRILRNADTRAHLSAPEG